jgi:hypothetical protein
MGEAIEQHMGFALPTLVGTTIGTGSLIMSLLLSQETRGQMFVSELMSYSSNVPAVKPAV